MTGDDVRAILRRECGDSQKAWAAAHSIVPSYVSDVLNRRRDPSPAICRALGLQRVVTYEAVPEKVRRKPKAGA